jgi:hypothetical protein
MQWELGSRINGIVEWRAVAVASDSQMTAEPIYRLPMLARQLRLKKLHLSGRAPQPHQDSVAAFVTIAEQIMHRERIGLVPAL